MSKSVAVAPALHLGTAEFDRLLSILANPTTTRATRFEIEDQLSVALREASTDDLTKHFAQVVKLAKHYPHAVDKAIAQAHPWLAAAHIAAEKELAAEQGRPAARPRRYPAKLIKFVLIANTFALIGVLMGWLGF